MFHITNKEFEELALKLFSFQAKHNQIYNDYLNKLNIRAERIDSLQKIPFLPISFFKNAEIKSGHWNEEHIFESSGTTNSINSKHYIKSLKYYQAHAAGLFSMAYSKPEDYHIMALLPSYLERNNSSLVFMVEHLIQRSGSALSGFYLDDFEKLAEDIKKAKRTKKKILLIGVTFGLLDFLEKYQVDLRGHIVMETGGMKGRRKELVREELHEIIKEGFNVDQVHSEYGMTELMSQAYSYANGLYKEPSCMKVIIRDMYDPFHHSKEIKQGGINVIDLANFNSCSFIETSDIGRINEGFFEILGRFDNSEIRGCNLMV